MSARIGTRQRAILDRLQAGDDLYNDIGLWSVGSTRVPQAAAYRLYVQGYVMHARTEPGAGVGGVDRVVYELTAKGRKA